MEMKIEFSKEDWQKTLKEANQFYRDFLMSAAVNKSVADTAREHLKNFADDGKNKKLSSVAGKSDEVHPAVKEAMKR